MEKNRMLPRWNRAFALMLVGGLGLSLGSNADSELPVVGPDAVVPVEAQAWAAFNWASYDQDKVVSWGDYQYSVYLICEYAISASHSYTVTYEHSSVLHNHFTIAKFVSNYVIT